jgi:hypothetical protein
MYKIYGGKNRRLIIIAIAVAVVILTVVLIFVNKPNLEGSQEQDAGLENNAGNTPGNIANGGIVAQADDWIYYINVNNNWNIWRMKTDGSNMESLNDDISSCINIAEDWIYYINNSNGNVYRMRTDGYGKEKLNDEYTMSICVLNGWIYHTKVEGLGNGIYRMRVDGSDSEKINGNNIDPREVNITAAGDWVYYSGANNDGIYRMKTDGSGIKKLTSDIPRVFTVTDGWIYYFKVNNGGVYRMRTDGSGRKKLRAGENDGEFWNLNVSGDWIYFTYNNDGDPNRDSNVGKIYRIKTDGSEFEKLNDDYAMNINIADDWIYYWRSGAVKIHKMRTDGSDYQHVE